jgi:tRNA threonylcarbamoyladenosine biosynthesis protein TsaE
MSTATHYLRDAAATEAAGAQLAGGLGGGMIVTLSGDLGAGKTTLVRGCLRALGWKGPVKSPSYPLVEHYPLSSLYFYHFDFYRFADPSEWETAGLADCFHRDAVCLIEWPERVAGRLPQPDLALTLTYPDDLSLSGRKLALAAHTEAGKRCLAAMTSADTGLP